MGELNGKAIIVTGASSGIGRVTAETLGGMGAELWLVGRSKAELANTARMVVAAGGPAPHVAPMDLATRGPLAALIAEVGAAHPHLFGLINNAGVMHPEAVLDGTIERWQAMFDINVMAMLEGCQAAVAAMRAHGKDGRIVNISSLQGRFEEPRVYGISKKAAEMITASLRQELEQDDIRVSVVIPGGFATNLARGLRPDELESLVSAAQEKGIAFTGPGSERVLADPRHVADAIAYIVTRPSGVNIQEMLIRPPVDMKV